jgi:transcriptional regulator with XRE-family HTH domain
MKVNERIKSIREKAGYSLNELAGRAGISQSHLRRVELGQSGITVDHLEMICDALGITLQEFFDVDTRQDEFFETVAALSPKQKQRLLEFLKTVV